LVLRAKSFFYFLCTQSYWLESDHSWSRLAAKITVLLQGALALIGAALFVRTKQPDAVLLVASAAAFAAVYTLTHGDIGDRYRLPIDPLLILFAVDSLATFWPRRRAAQRA
jgi:hypothetical protein